MTPIPYVALQQMFNGSAPWGLLAYEKAVYLDELTDGAIEVILEAIVKAGDYHPVTVCGRDAHLKATLDEQNSKYWATEVEVQRLAVAGWIARERTSGGLWLGGAGKDDGGRQADRRRSC